MNTIRNTHKVYGLFYKSHGTWTPYSNSQPLTLSSAQTVKNLLKKTYKSSVIIRRVKFNA